jgi:outer membrane protein assembly factor BamB
MSLRLVLALPALLLVPFSAGAAAPPADPLPGIEARLKKDVADRAALRALADFAATDGDAVSPSDPRLRLGNSVRAATLLRDLLAKAAARARTAVEKELVAIASALGQEKAGSLLPLLREALGADASVKLAEKFSEKRYSPFAEILLQQMRVEPGRATSARATLELARLYERSDFFPDAVASYRILGRDFPKDVVEGAKTGAALLDDLSSDKRFVGHLEPPEPRGPYRSYEVRRWRTPEGCDFSPLNESVPTLAAYRLTFDPGTRQLSFTKRGEEKPDLALEMPNTLFAQVMRSAALGKRARFTYQSLGQLVFLSLGDRLLAIDCGSLRLLWQRDLLRGDGRKVESAVGLEDGTVRVRSDDGTVQLLGVGLPLTPSCLVLPAHDRLLAVNPLTGQTLWSRQGIQSGTFLFHDESNVYVVRRDRDGQAKLTAGFRLDNGEAVKMKDFSSLLNRSRGQVAGRLLVTEPDGKKALVLRLVHPATQRDVWNLRFAAGSAVAESLTPGLTGVVEPDGTVHLIRSTTGKTLWKSSLFEKAKKDQPLDNTKTIWLVADSRYVFLAFDKETKQDAKLERTALFRSGSGLSSVPVHGWLSAYDRADGRLLWYDWFTPQAMLVGGEAEALPFLTMAATLGKGGRERTVVQHDEVRITMKRNGKLMYARGQDFPKWTGGAIAAIEADPRGDEVWLMCDKVRVDLLAKDKK